MVATVIAVRRMPFAHWLSMAIRTHSHVLSMIKKSTPAAFKPVLTCVSKLVRAKLLNSDAKAEIFGSNIFG